MKNKNTCEWPGNDELMIEYHDHEWGVSVHDDRKLFEFMVLDAFQAGLNWKIILHKRENFKKAFHNFDFNKIAKYGEEKIDSLLSDSGIIRNKQKINSTVSNAKAFIEVRKKFGTFDKYIWQFTDYKTIHNKFKSISEIPSTSLESDNMSIDLKKRGFKFVGSTICYAFMQAAGMVNDHIVTCNRYKYLKNLK